jgi:virulence factor
MINICLFGYGKWGRTVLKSLKEIKKIRKITVIKSRKDKSKIPDSTDWVFVTVSTINHFSVVKKALNNGINVFCEKPLTNKIKDDIELYRIAKKKNCKLYV